ncbi:Alpha/Beta hydrolase protein [Mycena filopes]|nr:Alpha/Beta hydrolase protein [Mycena filopes]
MRAFLTLVAASYASVCLAGPVFVNTTSGVLQGSQTNGVSSFKGVRFAEPAIGNLRWDPPVPFLSSDPQNATTLGPSCLQQFTSEFSRFLSDTGGGRFPPPPESEDCHFLQLFISRNVWAPASTGGKRLPVVVFIYGGSLAFGSASLPIFDGTALASQGIIFVSFNYRTNVFGFPGSPDLPLAANNLGFLDQELAFRWVQLNVARFGGDPKQVTIMVSSPMAIARHSPATAPFRAGIMLSGAQVSMSPTPSFAAFNNFSTAVGCTQAPGPARLACLKRVPAAAIQNFTDGFTTGSFSPVVDSVTVFSDTLQRIRTGLTARVPFIVGNTQDEGTVFTATLGLTDLPAFLQSETQGLITADQVRPLYPGLNDSVIISEVIKDVGFLCPAELWARAAVGAGISNVFRYIYGPVFADLQDFPGAGAWHSSDLPEIFGFTSTSATAPEVTLSRTMQGIIASFVKAPTVSPALNWPKYVPGSNTTTLAKIAYNGNVEPGNVVQAVESDSMDGPCALWNSILDVRV